jgi:type II secretory pathway component GspD/PulD (secretin)
MEPTVAVSIPILDTVTPQEAQELARAVQQSLDITKLSIDTARRIVVIRDRISKVRPAQLIFEQLGAGRPQVAIEVQFLEVSRTAFLSYGFLLPNQFPLLWLGSDASKRGDRLRSNGAASFAGCGCAGS